MDFLGRQIKDPHGHLAYQVQAGPFAEKVTESLKDIVKLLASQGYNLIIDDVSIGAVEVEKWKKALENYCVLYVGIIAPLEILEERERARGDRFLGGARGQYFKVHENVSYDLTIDSHAEPLEKNVRVILEALKQK